MSAWFLCAGCASVAPPPRWAEGGGGLGWVPSVWQRDDERIEILPNGTVLRDGAVYLRLDPAGRVTDDEGEPVALFFADGQVAGSDDMPLGRVGMNSAAPPDRVSAWVTIAPNGVVVWFSSDGDTRIDGAWRGCHGQAKRACTLVTHMVGLERYRRNPEPSLGVGVGIGVGY